MKKLKIILGNFRMFGVKYVFLDFFYHIFRFLYDKTVKDNQDKKTEMIKKRVNDYKMFIDKNGKGIHRDLYLKSIREPVSTKIMNSWINKGDIILDAGANIGYYVILESKKTGNKGGVYAIEPIKENFDLLKKNIELNRLKNVEAYNLAFSDRSGRININVSEEGNLNTPAKIGTAKRVDSVKSTTIDLFFKKKKKPTIMRMDIEGFEHVVFKGCVNILDSLEKIFVELHFPLIEKKEMISLLKLLKNKGFEIYKAVLEWERSVREETTLGKIVNYFYNKRSAPIIFDRLTIDELINSKEFIEGHLSLEVFFIKNKKNN